MTNVLTPVDVASRIELEFIQSDGEFAEQWRKEVMNVLEILNSKFADEVNKLVFEGEAYRTYMSELEILKCNTKNE